MFQKTIPITFLLILMTVVGLCAQQEDHSFTFPLKRIWYITVEEREATNYQKSIVSTPLHDDDFLYIASRNGVIYAIRKLDGTIAWKFSFSHPFALEMYQTDESLFVAADKSVFAIDKNNGFIRWLFDSEHTITSGIVGNASAIFAATENGQIVSLKLETGDLLWSTNVDDDSPDTVTSRLFVNDGLIYFGTASKLISAISADSGTLSWSIDVEGIPRSGFCIHADKLFFGTNDNYVYCVDSGSGKVAWKQKASGDVLGIPAVDESFLYFSARDRTLRIFKHGSGRPVRQSPLNLRANFDVKPLLVDDLIVFPASALITAHSRSRNFRIVNSFNVYTRVTSSSVYDPKYNFLYVGTLNGSIFALAPENDPSGPELVPDVVPEINDTVTTQPDRTTIVEEPEPEPNESEDSVAQPAESVVNSEESTDEEEPSQHENSVQLLQNARDLLFEKKYKTASELFVSTLKGERESSYTVTLGLYCNLESVERLTDRFKNEELLLFERKHQGNDCYFICIGLFTERTAAESFMSENEKFNSDEFKASVFRLDSFF